MKTAICTISTKSHIFKSLALLESVKQFSKTNLFCLVTDSPEKIVHSEIQFNGLNDLSSDAALKIQQKYKGDKLRWALKPVYVKYLLEQGYDQVIYVDNDIFFYSSPDFLFEKLKTSDFLLTPHFYKANPKKDQNWLEANFRVGLYNAGFFGATKNAIPILNWWTECCLYNVKKSYWRGLYDDQKYLDLIPVLFENIEIIKHRGCNFAGWNSDKVMVQNENEQLLINDDPLTFIHFAQLSVERFSKPDSDLYLAYKLYLEALQQQKNEFQFVNKKYTQLSFSTYFYYLRWKLSRLFE